MQSYLKNYFQESLVKVCKMAWEEFLVEEM